MASVGLGELIHRRADELSYGDQRRLELAIALAGKPAVLLVDEPTAGMSAAELTRMVDLLQALPATVSLLIVEHDMDVIAKLTSEVSVLHHGRLLAEGSWDAIRDDATVQEAYLGTRKRGGTYASRA
jgi:branched-chain amino acid transport system ATP-binding protein